MTLEIGDILARSDESHFADPVPRAGVAAPSPEPLCGLEGSAGSRTEPQL